jgi:hypothetical protein
MNMTTARSLTDSTMHFRSLLPLLCACLATALSACTARPAFAPDERAFLRSADQYLTANQKSMQAIGRMLDMARKRNPTDPKELQSELDLANAAEARAWHQHDQAATTAPHWLRPLQGDLEVVHQQFCEVTKSVGAMLAAGARGDSMAASLASSRVQVATTDMTRALNRYSRSVEEFARRE